jgi:hypothetical protein
LNRARFTSELSSLQACIALFYVSQHPMPTTLLKPDCSLATCLDEATFSHARVQANPLTLLFAADFDAFFSDWLICNEQEIKLRTALVRKNAFIVAADDELDAIVDAVNQAVLLEVKSVRTAALYLLYFGAQTAGQLKKPILSGQLETMRGWIASLTASPNPVLSALGARLVKAVAAADDAIAARLVAEQENRDFRAIGGRKELIDGLNALRKALYGKLSELPHARPELHLPASFAEQFFRHETAKKADPELTLEELKAAIAANNAATALLQGKLDKAIADAANAAKDQSDEDEARAELATADEARKVAAAKLAALTDKKKV